jgi:hypothetical protein
MAKEETPVKFVEAPSVNIEVPVPPTPEAPAVVLTAAPIAAPSIANHVKLEQDAQQLLKDAKALGIDFEIMLRGAIQRHSAATN